MFSSFSGSFKFGRRSSLSNIISNGLVLNLDAGNSNSYPGTGTTWTDLSGNGNNGTLINGPTYSTSNNGALVFDGTNDRGTFTTPIATSSTPQTYEVWVKATASASASGGFGYILYMHNTNVTLIGAYLAIGYAGSTLQTNEIYAAFAGNWINMGTGVIGDSTTVRQIVLTWNNAVQTVYVDGVQKNSQVLTTTPSNFSTTTAFADANTVPYRMINGSIYNIKAYNRALSAAEVAQNFNALRGRFGI